MTLANSDENTNTRRSFLRGAAGAAAAATGATAFSGTAAAVDVEHGDENASLPVEDELLLYVHGWFGEARTEPILFDSELQRLSDNLEESGYSADAEVNYTWGASSDTIDYLDATESTGDVGSGLATKIEEFYDNGDGNIRLVGHSLGGPVVLHALNELGSEYTVETVALLGASNAQQSVCGEDWSFGWDFTPGIETGAETIRNYHSTSDGIVLANLFFGVTDFPILSEGPIGYAGLDESNFFSGLDSPCSHSNWTDVDCTDAPGIVEHFKYFDSRPIGENLALTFQGESPETELSGKEYDIELGIYEFQNGWAMGVEDSSENEGANVVQTGYLDLNSQAWKIEEAEKGGYRVTVQHTGMVLAPEQGSRQEGTPLVQQNWTDSPYQRWLIQDLGDREYRMRNIGTGLVAEVDESSTNRGDNISLQKWDGGDNQRWKLNTAWNDINSGTYEIEAEHSGKIMEVSGASEQEGANVRQWETLDLLNQAWQISKAQEGGFRIIVQHTGKVLTANNEGTEQYTTLVQEDWHDSPHQRWLIQDVGGEYKLRNIGSGLVADVEATSTENGGDIHLFGWHGGDNQRWNLNRIGDISPTDYEIEAKHSGKIMEVAAASEDEGANVRQWDDWDRDNQTWKIEEAEQGGHRVTVQHTGKVLTANNEGTEQYTTLVQEDWRDSPHQRWLIREVDGEYKFKNIGSGLVADVEATSTEAGGDIHLYGWHGGDNQRWELNPQI
jgi:pimeloyl-ACP methyl ester carboxylesterase